ncbi:competence/damage-inducible protein A [bacterium]|nr:competence/damage-inducible protein A [bacterium]
MTQPPIVTAAVLIIGDEILSGRTHDSNMRTIAQFLAPLGVDVREARIVPDVRNTIIAAVQALSAAYTYVFTTGGIGPTHDDITADAVAAAFGRTIGVRDDARAILAEWYRGRDIPFTDARLRMARIPDGASLIANPVSGAPGFQIGNVFVLAGVPAVMRGMLEDIPSRITGGAVVFARTVKAAGLREAEFASALGEIAAERPDLSLGSYPWMKMGPSGAPDFGTSLVVRGRDQASVEAAAGLIASQLTDRGYTPRFED